MPKPSALRLTIEPKTRYASQSRARAWLIPVLTNLAMLLAFFLAPQFPDLESMLKPYAKYSLSVLLLVNALHIHYPSLGTTILSRPGLLGYGILVNNILLPLLVYAVSYFLWPDLLPAAVLLAGTSSGFSSVSFAILLRLKPETNLLITLGSSFLLPLSLPFLLYTLAGTSIKIDLPAMIWQTSWMVFVPMVLERILYFRACRLHSWFKFHSHLIVALTMSVTAFILMLSGQSVLRHQARNFWYILLFTIFVVVLVYVCTLLLFCRASLETQMTMLTANLVANTGMAAVLALDYLDSSTLSISIIFSILWNFNIVFLRIWPFLRQHLRRKNNTDSDFL